MMHLLLMLSLNRRLFGIPESDIDQHLARDICLKLWYQYVRLVVLADPLNEEPPELRVLRSAVVNFFQTMDGKKMSFTDEQLKGFQNQILQS